MPRVPRVAVGWLLHHDVREVSALRPAGAAAAADLEAHEPRAHRPVLTSASTARTSVINLARTFVIILASASVTAFA